VPLQPPLLGNVLGKAVKLVAAAPSALRSMSPANIGAVCELEGALNIAHRAPPMFGRQTLRATSSAPFGMCPDGTHPSVCVMGVFVEISLLDLTSFTAPSEGQLSATRRLATVAERRGIGRNRARLARHSTRQVRASQTLKPVPAQANRCRYS